MSPKTPSSPPPPGPQDPSPGPSGSPPARSQRPSIGFGPPPELPADEPVFDISDVGEETDDLVKEMVIREVVEHARRETRAVELARPMTSWRGRPIALGLIAAFSLFLAIHTYVARPEWAYGPAPGSVSPERAAAHLRYAMHLVARRVESHRASHGGAVPASLRETGERISGVSFRVLDRATYELSASVGDSAIVYRSSQDLAAFLGASARQLRQQAGRP